MKNTVLLTDEIDHRLRGFEKQQRYELLSLKREVRMSEQHIIAHHKKSHQVTMA